MQPNDQYQQPQFSSDYLNQIAPQAQVKTMNPFFLWGIIGAVLVLAIVVVLGVSSASGGPSSSSVISVAAKLANLKTVSDTAKEHIQSSELRTFNSMLNISLTNVNRDLTDTLKSQDVSLKDKKDPAVIAATKESEALSQRLEDARLNAVYDRTYAREMTYALKTLRSDMLVLYKKTRSTDLKTTLSSADDDMKTVVEGLESFNAS